MMQKFKFSNHTIRLIKYAFWVFCFILIPRAEVFSQTDTLFWFSAPEVNRYHAGGSATDPENFGTPVYLRLTTGDKPANVTISMPANPAFTPLVIPTIAEFTTHTVNLSAYIKNHEEIDGNGGLPGDVNDPSSIENVLAWTFSNLTPLDGKPYINRNNKGILVESDESITAYYEIGVVYNRDLIALKGQNALGTEFYVPFQTTNETRSYPYKYRPYSSIDIVATEDDTKIWFTATQNIWVKGVGARPKGTYSIWLNKGETSIITPYEATSSGHYQTTFDANKRLAGTRVWVDQLDGSGGDIAIISHDDLVKSQNSGNPDYVADQIVPITHIGNEYAVIRGVNYNATESEDYIYVVGTEDGTNVTIVTDPTAHTETFSVDAGESDFFHISSINYNVASVYADKPVYVYHMSGTGRQKAGALIPTISKCTGSNRVAFNRTTPFDFFLNILVWVSPTSDARGDFNLIKQGGALDVDDNSVLTQINDPSNFSILPTAGAGVEFGNWYYARINAAGLDDGVAYTLQNTENVFHLGVLNGRTADDAFYGYFSNFNEIVPQGIVVETGSNGGKFCPGVTLDLEVSGGTKYSWFPDTYLDNPNIRNPTATNIEASIDYLVTVSGYCDDTEKVPISVKVGDNVIPNFTADTYYGCAAPEDPSNPSSNISFTFELDNDSDGDYYRDWWYRRSDETSLTHIVSGSNADNTAEKVFLTLDNNTDQIIEYYVTLRVQDGTSWCQDEVTKILRVYPYIDVNAASTIVGDPNCQPLTVNLTGTPAGNFDGATYKWDFDDGNSAATQNASNTYNNTAPPYNSIDYYPEVTITDKWNVCSATDSVLVTVPPYLEAGFTANPVESCSPLNVANFSNTSKGADSYEWRLYKDGVLVYPNNSNPPNLTNLTNTNTNNQPVIYRLELDAENTSGCLKTYLQEFTVYPNPDLTNFSVTPNTTICSPVEVTYLADGIINTDTYTWFVDANSVVGSPAVVPASSTGTYDLTNNTAAAVTRQVSYVATNDWGCSNTWGPVDVVVEPFVEAKISLSPEEGCSPLAVTFTNNSSAGSSIIEWNLDGTTYPNAAAIPATFTNPNTNNTVRTIPVTLTAENTAGCTDTDTRTITVYPRAVASFDVDFFDDSGNPIAPGDPLCAPVTGDFTGTYQNATIYSWDFGELGDKNVENPQDVVFPNTTTANKDYTVTLVASNTFDCPSNPVTDTYIVHPEVKANFDIETLASCVTSTNPFELDVSAPSIANINYSWDYEFNAQTAGNVTDPTFTNITENKTGINQEYDITLTATGLGGCSDTKTETVTIYPEVQAQWTGDLTERCAPADINLTNNSNLFDAASTSVTNIQWQVFDGATLVTSSSAQSFTPTLPNTSHTAQKTYDVRLTATSADGCVGQVDNQITVNPNPLAKFNASITDACTPLVLDVVDESVTTPASTYTWDWDNESSVSSSGQDHTVTYNNNTATVESKHISLNILNEYGCVSDYDYLFEVFPQVNASFSITRLAPNDNCGDEEFTFSNNSTAGTSIDYYEWSFGTDKLVTTSTADFNRSFTASGTNPLDIPVSVRAYSSIGCTNATPAEQTITVFPQVVAAQSFDIGDICDGDVDLTLANTSSNVGTSHADATTDFLWTFTPSTADGTLTTSSGATVILTNGGDINPVVYDVDFVAETEWNYNGINRTCRDAITGNSVTVYPNLDLTFDIPDAECSTPTGVELVFAKNIPSSSGGDVNDISIAWDFGDGNTATSNFNDVTHTFTNISNQPFTTATTFTATQLATGCTFEDNIPVTVYPTVTAAQSFTLGNLCGGTVEVTLANASSNTGVTTGINNFEWRFTPDDPANGTEQTFTSTGTYQLTNTGATDPVTYSLEFFGETVWNEGTADEKSCQDVITPATQVVVYPELLPVFQAPDAACSGQTGVPLTFVKDNAASKGGNPTDVTIEWNFGDGNTQSSSFNNVTHTFLNIDDVPFTTATEYTATQLATGCTVTDAIPVTVYPRVTAAQSFNITDECNGVTLDLTNASTNKSIANSTFSWAFTTTDDGGSDVLVDSPGDALSGVNLENSHQTDPVTYSLSFTALTNWGGGDECQHTVSGQDVTVYPILNPIYDIPPAVCSGLNGADLEFVKNASSSGGGVNDVSLQWDFSDGNTRTTTFDPSVTKQFTNLSDEDFITSTKIFATQIATGCTVQREVDVRVHPKVESIFTFEIDDVCEYPLPVTFANASKYSKAQTGVPTEFIWDYGYQRNGNPEGETLTPSEVSHTYYFYNDELNQIQEYDVSLTITQTHDVSGEVCANTATRKIQVYPEMLPSFNLPTTEGCNPLTVSFENNSTGVNLDKVDGTPWNGQFVWDLGNGSTSSSITPATREYGHADKTQSHIYNVSLTATNPLGCVKTATTSTPQVTVYPWVESSFTVDRIEGCTPLDVVLSNKSKSTEYTYQWAFNGNGADVSLASSTDEEPGTVRFTNPLGANNELLVQNPEIGLTTSLNTAVYTVGGGCAKTSTPIQVSVFPHVYPSFDATLEGCHPLDVDFQNTSNVFGQTDNGNYTWDLGIGIQTNNQDHQQEYLNPSLVANETYTGRLTAVSEHGCTDNIPFTVTVWPKPQARIELNEYMECSPFNLEIINQSIGKGKGSTLKFTYDFGDESDDVVTTDEGSVTHSYRNFSDEIEPFTMSLYVETEDGCNDIAYQTVHAYPEVTAIFDTDDGNYQQCNPFEVEFVNTSLNAWSYIWDFDNGITSSTTEPVYRFDNNSTQDRTYNVKLTAMSEYDCEHTSDLDITVFAAPIADFAIIPPHQVFPEDGSGSTFEFRNQSRPGSMPSTWAHTWTFGDGYTSTSMETSVEHTYEDWGFRDDEFRYEVTLSIDNGNCSDFISHKLTLLPPEPKALYDVNKDRSCSPLELYFENLSQFYFTDADAKAFEWWLDGETLFSTEKDPTLVLTEPGYYNVGLRVFGDGGEKNFYRTFRVFENPVAMFEAMPERVLLPNAQVHFFNLSEKASKFVWDFGDGTPKLNDKDPAHIYNELGEYRVSLTAFAQYEYKDEIFECIDYYSQFPAVWVEGEGKINFPNAFMPSKLGPNGGYYDDVDYRNEVFHPVADGVIEYRLVIFNRWGEQIFESNYIKIGWDGYYKGKLASQGVYVWRAVGKFSNGELFDEKGNVTLLR